MITPVTVGATYVNVASFPAASRTVPPFRLIWPIVRPPPETSPATSGYRNVIVFAARTIVPVPLVASGNAAPPAVLASWNVFVVAFTT